jgi:hypothetical protein
MIFFSLMGGGEVISDKAICCGRGAAGRTSAAAAVAVIVVVVVVVVGLGANPFFLSATFFCFVAAGSRSERRTEMDEDRGTGSRQTGSQNGYLNTRHVHRLKTCQKHDQHSIV